MKKIFNCLFNKKQKKATEKKYVYQTKMYHASLEDIESKYQQELNQLPANCEIVFTSISHGYGGYGFNNPMVLIVTYKFIN